jgi:hypothetical protein
VPTKEQVEQVAKRPNGTLEGIRGPTPANLPVPVIVVALPRIAQDGVGFVDFLEALRGVRIIAADIGVGFARQTAVGRFDFILRRAALDAKDLIEVAGGPGTTQGLAAPG